MKHVIPLSAKLHIYNSLILSHLNVCILVWGYKCDRFVKFHKQIVAFSASANTMHIQNLFARILDIDGRVMDIDDRVMHIDSRVMDIDSRFMDIDCRNSIDIDGSVMDIDGRKRHGY